MAEAGNACADLGLPGGDTRQWPLQRYGRFVPTGDGEPPAPGQGARAASSHTWKVFDSNEESGYLVLTIVISGHFFISQGQTLLEGFSLVGSRSWLKIVRRVDCLLFGTTSKSRMFRVQFAGESREQALGRCCSCAQSLAQYTAVEGPGPDLPAGDGLEEDGAGHVPPQHAAQDPEQQACRAAGRAGPGPRTSVTELAQAILATEELPPAYRQCPRGAGELGPFLRLCLLDQHFPAFVEEVEKELEKLTGLGK
ncbi:meiotic recombination protein REC114 [Oryctolagus cuniculus]|uniref:meiotic recombination protein REC114 n=1 Tax=Oryctolagus cuniculus TaxID=9986 RepID=UPI0003905442|nr:meiotic recombination protein REC114 [Oryctolagus cuniculus]